MTDQSGSPGRGAAGRLALTSFEEAWRKNRAAGKREPLTQAKFLELYLYNCERIWRDSRWSVWHVLSWIAFREKASLCNIRHENSLSYVKCFGPKNHIPFLKEANPESVLLAALKSDELKAIRHNTELPKSYWTNKSKVDRDIQFRRTSVRHCWPRRDEWNRFRDEFWSLAQMILWIVTRDPEEIDQAGNGEDRVCSGSGYGGLTAAAKLAELLHEDRNQVEDAVKDLLRSCQQGQSEALLGQDVVHLLAWSELTIDFKGDGMPFVRQENQRVGDPGWPNDPDYDHIRFSRVEALHLFEPIEKLRREQRTRRANAFNRRQDCIAPGKRRWLRLTEIAREYASKPKSLGEIDDARRRLALEELRYSIQTREFVDKRGRSRVLNMHPSPVAGQRFAPEAARHLKLFESIAEHLWITHQDAVDWFDRHDIDLPRRLQKEPPSALTSESAHLKPAARTENPVEPVNLKQNDRNGDHEEQNKHQPVSRAQSAKRGKGAHARDAALKAIREVYGDSIPDQSTIRNGPFCNAVRAKLPPILAGPPEKGGIHNDTILRAAGRKK